MKFASHSHTSQDLLKAGLLRRNATPAERALWRVLAPEGKKYGFHFRRQLSLPPYVADFGCYEPRILNELDGSSHDATQVYDALRTKNLLARGFITLRFANSDIYSNVEGVVETIIAETVKLQKITE